MFFYFYFFYSVKKSSNGQGGQSRIGAANLNSESNAVVGNARITQNGVHAQSRLHGIYTRFDLCIPLNIFFFNFFYHDFVVFVCLEFGLHNSDGI